MSLDRRMEVAISDIEGGEAPERIDMDDDITIKHLYDTYRRYPSYRDLLKLTTNTIWSNYLNEDTVPFDRVLELKDAHEDCLNYGYAAVIVDATVDGTPRCDRVHPRIEGVGFRITKVSKMGLPLRIEVQSRFSETQETSYAVDHYPCETTKIKIGEEYGKPKFSEEYIRDKPIPGQRGFFLIRTRGGKKGIRGLPKFLHLIMLIRKGYDIIENYAMYAENQALASLFVKLEDLSPENKASLRRQWDSQLTHRKMVMLSSGDEADWKSALKNAWDPFPMLSYLDKLYARTTQLNKLMLEGDPAGHLSASETALNNWISKVKEDQAFWMTQFKPILIALGASEDVAFNDPSKPTFISLMQGLKACREALDGIVEREDIVDLFNEYLSRHDQKRELTAIKEEDIKEKEDDINDGNFGSGQGVDKGGKTAPEESTESEPGE